MDLTKTTLGKNLANKMDIRKEAIRSKWSEYFSLLYERELSDLPVKCHESADKGLEGYEFPVQFRYLSVEVRHEWIEWFFESKFGLLAKSSLVQSGDPRDPLVKYTLLWGHLRESQKFIDQEF